MNVVVCIKQVPGTTEVKIDLQTNTLVREGMENIVNP
ncbi:MAG: electron transfer flavoprotein subunit beta, partial [Dehalococcoidia bacterium]